MAQNAEKPFLLIYGLLMGLLIALSVLFHLAWEKKSIFIPQTENSDRFGAHAWVKWEDSNKGVRVKSVHPLTKSNDQFATGYLEKGDLLKKIDYRLEPYSAKSVTKILYDNAPGKVFIFQVQRDDPSSFTGKTLNLFIRNSVLPTFTFFSNGGLWNLLIWLSVVGTLISLMVILILMPIIRTNLKDKYALLTLLICAFLLFFLQLLHHIVLLVESDFTSTGFERFFMVAFVMLVLLYALTYFRELTKSYSVFWSAPLIIAAALLGWRVIESVYGHHFYLHSGLIQGAIMGFFMIVLVFCISLSIFRNWKERSWKDKAFHLSVIAATIAGMAWYFNSGGPDQVVQTTDFEYNLLFFCGFLFVPISHLAAGELKFGKVSLVLNRAIIFSVAAIFAFFFYFVILQLLQMAGIDARYRTWFALAILIILAIVAANIFWNYGDRLRRYFILTQQKQQDHLKRFISLIPQFTSSENLLSSLTEELKGYFGADPVFLRMNEERKTQEHDPLEAADLAVLRDALKGEISFWSSNKLISPVLLSDDLEDKLQNTPIRQIHLIDVKEGLFGFLFLGKKKRGVYNLDDLEWTARTIQQTRLTLDVLYLVEREKILMEKNYEANLTALRSQINPHFLFNTLNTISALIHDAPEQAEDAIEKLAFIFRYTLMHSGENFVTIEREMELVKTYLDIEQMRFGKRLEVIYSLDEEAMLTQIPSLVIQTVIENCVKHGVSKIIGKGLIQIAVFEKGDFVICEMIDNGPGIDVSKIYTSTGLSNIITRVEQVYKRKDLLLFENTGNGTKVSIKLPLEY